MHWKGDEGKASWNDTALKCKEESGQKERDCITGLLYLYIPYTDVLQCSWLWGLPIVAVSEGLNYR